MEDKRKQELINLGVDRLAEVLIELSEQSSDVYEVIERLTSTPDDNLNRFKKNLASIKRSKRFIGWHDIYRFSNELKLLLEDLKAGATDPLKGLELVSKFYEADKYIFNRCNDSSGIIGDIFTQNAKELFEEYAIHCFEKKKIADIIIKLCNKDEYGVRDALLDSVYKFLPKEIIRSMISYYQKKADKEIEDYNKRQYLFRIESLASQLGDAEIFEKTRVASLVELTAEDIIDIAKIHLLNGESEKAYNLLNEIPKYEQDLEYEKEQLLKTILMQKGDIPQLEQLLLKQFRNCHCLDYLDEYLSICGND